MAHRTLDKVLLQNVQRLRRDVSRAASGERVLSHIPTGFEAIDGKYGGARIGVVTELLGQTGDGKSAFMRQLAEGAARAGVGVLWFVLEDPEAPTAERQLSNDTGIDTAAIGRLDLSQEELQNLQRAAEQSVSWADRVLPIFEPMDVDELLGAVDETTTISGRPVGLVLVDYVQLLGESRSLEDDIARLGVGLHARSRARSFASVAGSQVANDRLRIGRERYYQTKTVDAFCPSQGDTEWCKRLEKLCKAQWAIFRPNRWKREMGEDAVDDVAELWIRKQNFGPTGWVPLGWDGATCRFINP